MTVSKTQAKRLSEFQDMGIPPSQLAAALAVSLQGIGFTEAVDIVKEWRTANKPIVLTVDNGGKTAGKMNKWGKPQTYKGSVRLMNSRSTVAAVYFSGADTTTADIIGAIAELVQKGSGERITAEAKVVVTTTTAAFANAATK